MAASTVAQYLAALPADRRAVINENLPEGYEVIQFAMTVLVCPLYPAG